MSVRPCISILLVLVALTIEWPVLMAQDNGRSSLVIWPIDPTMAHNQHSTALWLENRGDHTLTLQIRVVGWTTVDFEEVLSDEQERVIASPPVAVVPQGRRQLVRLVRLEPAHPGREDAYRVIVDELPGSGRPSVAPASLALGVSLRLRYSLPLFVYGPGLVSRAEREGAHPVSAHATPDLQWRLVRSQSAQWLHVRNAGSGHARLSHVRVRTETSEAPLSTGLLGYVLPATERRWMLPPALGGLGAVFVDAHVNGRATAAVAVP